jgi:OmpA-OmpF porin, OOP family
MKIFIAKFILFALYLISNQAISQKSIITEAPIIERSNTKEAIIEKVELTEKYTIIYMSFELGRTFRKNERQGNGNPTLQDLLDLLMKGATRGNQNEPSAFISIRPSSKLIALEGDRTYKFIKASGIPVEPQKLDIYPNEKVNFRLYYEKIEPGITRFDFFEGDNSDEVRYWNYYNVQITNPAEKIIPNTDKTDPAAIEPAYLVKGKVFNIKTNKPVNAKLEFLLSPQMEAVDSAMSYYNSGAYKITLPKKGVYSCVVSAPGYLIKQESIDLTSITNNNHTLDIYLTPIEKGDVVLLNNVYFETGEYELLSASFSELNKLVVLLNDNPKLIILLEGHTDIVGDKKANIELSQKRVNSVKDYLILKGIQAKRIETKGWGSSKPLNTNGNENERKVNRRVEFRVLNL